MRQLARIIGVDHSNLRYWEQSGKSPRSDLLPAIAEALGVSVEELLGVGSTRRPRPGGRLGRTFEELSHLPRGQQARILDVVEALVARHRSGAS